MATAINLLENPAIISVFEKSINEAPAKVIINNNTASTPIFYQKSAEERNQIKKDKTMGHQLYYIKFVTMFSS